MWNEHHTEFSDSLHRFFTSVGVALKRLNEMQFDAPWRRGRSRRPGQA